MPHFPTLSSRVDATLCERSLPQARRQLFEAVAASSAKPPVAASDASWLAADPTLTGIDRAKVESWISSIPLSDGTRRLRIELLPLSGRDCISLKLFEECAPELAPEGDPRTWHACGDPSSGPFLRVREDILGRLGVAAGEVD
jgi:hypothetical protein